MKRIRPSTYVEEGNLTQNISLLRKALGESPGGVQFIETVPRRGYRFVGDINESWDGVPLNGPISAPVPVVEAETVSQDRKSTRLNSSHLVISYAVFCLK